MPTTVVGASSASIGTSGWFRVVRRIASSVSEVEPHLLERALLLLAARELGQLRDQVGHLAKLRDDVLEQLLALVGRQLAALRSRAARCSCAGSSAASAARARRPGRAAAAVAAPRRATASIALNVVASRLSSSLPRHLDPLREVARRAHVLGRLAQVAHRLQRGARDQEAGDGGDPDAAERDEQQPQPDLRQLVIDVRQRRRDHDAKPSASREVNSRRAGR